MTTPLTSRWRWPAAAALSVTAAIHVALVPSHLHEAPYAGALFIAVAATALLVAILLLAADDRFAWLTAAALAAAVAVAYLVSRSIGLPSLDDDIGDWLNPLGLAAGAAELAVVSIAVCVLAQARQPRTISRTGPAPSTGVSPSR